MVRMFDSDTKGIDELLEELHSTGEEERFKDWHIWHIHYLSNDRDDHILWLGWCLEKYVPSKMAITSFLGASSKYSCLIDSDTKGIDELLEELHLAGEEEASARADAGAYLEKDR